MNHAKIRSTMRKTAQYMCLVIGILSVLLVLYYIIFIGKGHYHSDCTDTILWAQASLDGNDLVNSDFSYAGIMPLGGNIIMLPFVAAYGVSLKAQILGMVVFAFIFIGSIVFMAKSMKIENEWITVMIAVVLFTTCSSGKFREIFWEHIIYYSLGILFLMIGLGSVLRCIRRKYTVGNLKNALLWYNFLFLFVIISSINGMQMLTMCEIPLLAAVAAERFFDFKTPLINSRYIKNYLTMIVIMIGTAIGLVFGKLVIHGVKARYAQAYSSFSDKNEWVGNFFEFFPKFFSLIGVDTKTSMIMYSYDGIIHLLRIIFAFILIIVPFMMLMLYKKFDDISYRLMILCHHFMAVFIMIGWTFGKLNSAEWRLTPIAVSSAIMCVLFMRWLVKNSDYKRLAAIVAIPVVCMAVIVTRDISIVESQTDENKELDKLEKCLEDNNLEYGYASFWQANIITLISNSKVKSRVINIDEFGFEKRMYQTNKNWYENVNGYDKYFVILDEGEYEVYNKYQLNYEKPQEMIQCGKFKILIYDKNIFR